MAADNNRPARTSTVPGDSMMQLAQLLGDLDEFLRSDQVFIEELAAFLHHRGTPQPRFAAFNLVDELCFTAAHLRTVAQGVTEVARSGSKDE